MPASLTERLRPIFAANPELARLLDADPSLLPRILRDYGLSEETRRLTDATDPEVWSRLTLGYDNAPFHKEWYSVAERYQRCCIVAPRDHGKTETLTVNRAAWHMLYRPGTWIIVFAATLDQAKALKQRIHELLEDVAPEQVIYRPREGTVNNATETRIINGSRVTVASAGKAVRGGHPDIIIGDDVLEEKLTLTDYQRKKTARWWNGTVANMAHSGTTRRLPNGVTYTFPPTRITLVGTPFHRGDLLMSMKDNPLYAFRRYAAEFDPARLPMPGSSVAVEIS